MRCFLKTKGFWLGMNSGAEEVPCRCVESATSHCNQFTSSSSVRSRSGHVTCWRFSPTSSSLVEFHHHGVHNTLKLLLLALKFFFFCHLIVVEPIKRLLHVCPNLALAICLKFILQRLLLKRVPLAFSTPFFDSSFFLLASSSAAYFSATRTFVVSD